ncbi:MAG: hypothetical protein JW731_10980 [Bacteroidales bacterium]|nr:hypothetical protein [Bacteroidales bacterium]
MTNRRSLLKNVTNAAAATLLLTYKIFAFIGETVFGFQHFTNFHPGSEDVFRRLKLPSEIGFNSFDAVGNADGKFYRFEPAENGNICLNPGVQPLSSHSIIYRTGKKCMASGLNFGYRKYTFEIEEMEGQVPYDIFLENTDPKYWFRQFDFYGVVYVGYDPSDFFDRFPGRFEFWHVKEVAGLKYFFLEQEAFKMDPVNGIRQSYHYLKTL